MVIAQDPIVDQIVRTTTDATNLATGENSPITEAIRLRIGAVDGDAGSIIIAIVFVVLVRIYISGAQGHIVPSIRRTVKGAKPSVAIRLIMVDEVDSVVLSMLPIDPHNKMVPVAQGTSSVDHLRVG